MAATTSQGKSFAGFIVGITVTAAGAAAFGAGIGKAALGLGILTLLYSIVNFIKVKPEEGKVPAIKQVLGLQLGGVLFSLAGWVLALAGMHLTASVGARLIIALIGLAISLVGVLGLLPAAANKNAIWKA